MKRLYSVLLFFVATKLFSQDIGEGDQIQDLLSNSNFQYLKIKDYVLPDFKEIKFGVLALDADLNLPTILCTVENGKPEQYYGVLDGSPPNAYFLFDTNGDGDLDYRTSEGYIPNWILFHSPMKREKPDKFISLCNEIYSIFNSEIGPTEISIGNSIKKMVDVIHDPNAPNRDLYYSLFSYISNTKNPQIGPSIILSLAKNVSTNYNNEMLPLFLLYSGESFTYLGDYQSALSMFRMLESIDKNSIIAKYYIAYHSDKQAGGSENIANFRNKYKDFWILKK